MSANYAPPPGVAPALNYGIEGTIAVFIALFFVVSAAMSLKERHRDTAAWHVTLGAFIYGLLFGAIVGFVIVPARIMLTTGGTLPPQIAGYATFGFLLAMIALRRGLLARLPFLGPQVKAYRRASLRRQIEAAQKQLDRLTPARERETV